MAGLSFFFFFKGDIQTRQRHFDSLKMLRCLQKSSPSRLKSGEGVFRRTVELASVSFAPFGWWEYRSINFLLPSTVTSSINGNNVALVPVALVHFRKPLPLCLTDEVLPRTTSCRFPFPCLSFSPHLFIYLHTVLLLWTSLRLLWTVLLMHARFHQGN